MVTGEGELPLLHSRRRRRRHSRRSLRAGSTADLPYQGCPEQHPDCSARELRWQSVEAALVQRSAAVEDLHRHAALARNAIAAATTRRQRLETRGQELEDSELERSAELRRLKDEVMTAHEATAALQARAASLRVEIDRYRRDIDSQRINSFYADLPESQRLPVMQV